MKELRRIKPPQVPLATSLQRRRFSFQIFFSGQHPGQTVLRGRRSYGTGGPTGQAVHPGQAWMVLGAFVFLILDDSGYDAFRKFE